MEFEIGQLVTRNSYNNDIIFEITDIIDNIVYLKGINIRLKADSDILDLKKFDTVDEDEREFIEKIKPTTNLNKEIIFYLTSDDKNYEEICQIEKNTINCSNLGIFKKQ